MKAKQLLHALIWVRRHLAGKLRVEEIEAVARFIRPGDVCLDIGAHAGAWSRALAEIVGQGGHVYAFEALPYYAQVLDLTIALLALGNVTVINVAVTEHDGPVTLVWKNEAGERLTGLTHVAYKTEDVQGTVVVDGTSLDSFISHPDLAGRVTFVKGDVEGYEFMVLQGASSMIQRFRPVFYLEVQTDYCRRYGYRPLDLFRFLGIRDYCAYIIRDGELLAIDEDACGDQGDVLFVPLERLPELAVSRVGG